MLALRILHSAIGKTREEKRPDVSPFLNPIYRREGVARITIEDCLRKVSNRFMLVNMVAKRVRQIREGSEYLVSSPKNEDIVISLREVAAGRIVAVSDSDTET